MTTPARIPNPAHVLYYLAEQADARLSATIAARCDGRTRWTLHASDYAIREVKEALRAKLNADEAWLTFLRTSRERGRS